LSVSQKSAWYIKKSQDILDGVGIPILRDENIALTLGRGGDELLNLTWATNGGGVHRLPVHKAVYEALVDGGGTRAGVRRELLKLRRTFLEGGLPGGGALGG
jgi:hypothetical protein